MRRYATLVLAVVGAALVGAQLVPVERSNPPVSADVPAPPEVKALLRRACYDCHSHETAWPWYAHVAPVSWLVAHDVAEGREQLNFSAWDRYGPRKRTKALEETREAVEEGEMPLAIYAWLHAGARLTDAEREALVAWTEAAGSQPGSPAPAPAR